MTEQKQPARKTFVMSMYASKDDMIADMQDTIWRLHAVNEFLCTSLKTINAQAEHFEREWYLRGDELEALRGSQQAERAVPSEDQITAALKAACMFSTRESRKDMRAALTAAGIAAPVQQSAPAVEAEMRKKAERYDWLRHGDNDEKVLRNGPVAKDYWYLLRGEKLDAAIDAALASQKDKP